MSPRTIQEEAGIGIYDFPAILKALEVDAAETARGLEWLHASWRDPEGFSAALFAWQQTRDTGGQRVSLPRGPFDFYTDIVLRRLAPEPDAVLFRGRGPSGPESLTVAEAHARAATLASGWVGAGVRAGETVCIVLPMGTGLVAALLAAFRLGLGVSYLPPQGDRFLAARLALLAPDHVVSDYAGTKLLGEFAAKVLPETPRAASVAGGGEGEVPSTFEYPHAAAVGWFFSPHVDPVAAPRPISAEDLYHRALRDAALAYGMRPAELFGAAALHSLQHQPVLLLASLLCGATYVDVPADEAPATLAAERFAAVGVGRDARDALIAAEASIGKSWSYWWKNPAEAGDLPVWIELSKACGLDPVPSGSALVEAASGGALLFSVRRRRNPNLQVLPSAGAPFHFADITAPDKPAIGPVGLFTSGPAGSKDVPPTNFIVAKLPHGPEWFYVGTRDFRRSGRAYPKREVLAAIDGVEGADRPAIVFAPASSAATPVLFVLLLFAGPDDEGVEEADASAVRDDLARRAREEIERRMGAEFAPDQIEVFPFYPRETKGAPDESWCQGRYVMGLLHRRSRSRLGGLLARARRTAQEGG